MYVTIDWQRSLFLFENGHAHLALAFMTELYAAKNIRMIGLADSLGLSVCVKSSSVAALVSASAKARGVDVISA